MEPVRYHLTLRTDAGESTITLLDTSGFGDSSRHDTATPNEKAVDLCKTYAEGNKLSGILYFHRISDIPADCPPITSIQRQAFHELCGDDSGMLKNVILATNRWDLLETEEAGVRSLVELENDPRYWKPMLLKGSQVARFDGTTESALNLIQLFIHNSPLQTVGENKLVTEASTRRFVEAARDIFRMEQKQTLATIMEGMQLLKGESERSKREIDELREQQRAMKADAENILTQLREERKLREEEQERMGNKLAGLKVNIKELEREQRQRNERDLKNAGYDPCQGQASATNALSATLRNQDSWIIRLLLAAGADPELCIAQPNGVDSSALHLAADMGYGDAIDIFIQRGVELDIVDNNGNTALIRAAGNGHTAVVDTLLGKEAKLDAKNIFGATPLLEAARHGHVAVASLLLAKGAGIDHAENEGNTPLIAAAADGHEAVVHLLLEKNAKPDIVDKKGNTALIRATGNGHTAIVYKLLGKGAKPDTKNMFGTTPLLEAARHGHVAVTSLLLAKGAEIDHAENKGNTPLIFAAAYGHEAVVRLLLEKNANPDIANNTRHAALTYAAWKGYESIVDLLLTKGANIDIKTITGDTALTLATKSGCGSVVRLLDEHRATLVSSQYLSEVTLEHLPNRV